MSGKNGAREAYGLLEILGAELSAFLARIGAVAEEGGVRTFLVGGVVRDLLLGRPSPDIDILVEGDAGQFVTTLEQRWGELFPDLPPVAKRVLFPKYGTAKLIFEEEIRPGMMSLDFASARGERYPASGQPPEVFRADLTTDLRRRDFTVNALALGLNPELFGELIDVVGGKMHLEKRLLSILHPKSFEDDPARLLRALRFAERFGFSFERETWERFREGATGRLLLRLTPQRRFDELRKTLAEPHPARVVTRLAKEDLLLPALVGLPIKERSAESFGRAVEGGLKVLSRQPPGIVTPLPWEIALAALGREVSESEFEAWLGGCRVPPESQRRIIDARRKLFSGGNGT